MGHHGELPQRALKSNAIWKGSLPGFLAGQAAVFVGLRVWDLETRIALPQDQIDDVPKWAICGGQ